MGAAIALGIGSAAAGIGSSILGSRRAKKQQEAEARLQREARALEQRDQDFRRDISFLGQEGTIRQNANAFLNQLSNNRRSFRDLENIATGAISRFQPAIQGSEDAINNLFTGESLREKQIAQNKVNRERIGAANNAAQNVLRGLNKTISRINSSAAARGFKGGSSFQNKLLAGANIDAIGRAGALTSEAAVRNAQDNFQLVDENVDNQLANAKSVGGFIADRANLDQLPFTFAANNISSDFNRLIQPTTTFANLGSSITQGTLPAVTTAPTPSIGVGEAALAALPSVISGFQNQQNTNRIIDALGQSGGANASTASSGNNGFISGVRSLFSGN